MESEPFVKDLISKYTFRQDRDRTISLKFHRRYERPQGTLPKIVWCACCIWLVIPWTVGMSQEMPGMTFQPAKQISFDSVLSNLPQIVVSGDTIHIIWFGTDTSGAAADDGIQYSRSMDGGLTFGGSKKLLSYDSVQNPGLMAVADSVITIAFYGSIDTVSGIFLLRSTDAGGTWESPKALRRSAFPLSISAIDSFIYLYFTDRPGGTYGMLRSANYGAAWIVAGTRLPYFNDLVATRSMLHAVGPTSGLIDDEVGYFTSRNRGSTWAYDLTLSFEDVTPSISPRICANEEGMLVTSWIDSGTILSRASRNGGATWAYPVTISRDRGIVVTDIASSEEYAAVAWDRESGNPDGVHVRSSNAYGLSYFPATSPAASRQAGEPSVAMRGNKIHLVWWEDVTAGREIFWRMGEIAMNPGNQPPAAYKLRQNYPNPVNGMTRMEFELPLSSPVTVTMYDVLGRSVRSLVDGEMEAGRYAFDIDLGDLPSGVYYYRLVTPQFSAMNKLMLIR